MPTPLPARNILDGSATPTTSAMKTAMGGVRDYLAGLLGTTGSAVDARTALGVAALADLVGVTNLRLVAADTANNILGIYAESIDAVPTAADPITVAVPTVNGIAFRTREAGFLSGTDKITLADAANYWSKGSLDAEIKTAWLYAIAPAAGGIVWALGGYAGFTRVPVTTTVTDDDYMLLEGGSTYTRAATDYCVCVGRFRYQYDTADTPDHTLQTSVIDAPQITYNPRSDYGYTISKAADSISGSDITDFSAVSVAVKQSGKYLITGQILADIAQVYGVATAKIKTGSGTYASAALKATAQDALAQYNANSGEATVPVSTSVYLNYDDTIHLGAAVAVTTGSGNRTVYGGANNYTRLTFTRED